MTADLLVTDHMIDDAKMQSCEALEIFRRNFPLNNPVGSKQGEGMTYKIHSLDSARMLSTTATNVITSFNLPLSVRLDKLALNTSLIIQLKKS